VTSFATIYELLQQIVEDQAAIRDELRQIRESFKAPGSSDPRHDRLLDSIDGALGDRELPFSSEEVIDAGEVNYELGAALAACDIADTGALGALLRTIKAGQQHPRFLLLRDSRNWRLVPR
jgi:hypothetical protein